jgi:hypothetical protein
VAEEQEESVQGQRRDQVSGSETRLLHAKTAEYQGADVLGSNALAAGVLRVQIITTNQAAILALFRVVNRYIGNLQPMADVFPDYRLR